MEGMNQDSNALAMDSYDLFVSEKKKVDDAVYSKDIMGKIKSN